jgi:predicted GNAT family acetyltransferase
MDDDPAISWVDNSNERRYELLLDGVRAGLTTYTLGPGEITYLHTEIDPEYQGRGLAGWLAAAVLDDARRRDLVVHPRCPFIRSYIARHAEYADLVAPGFDPHAG